jgi:hypothetical protein
MVAVVGDEQSLARLGHLPTERTGRLLLLHDLHFNPPVYFATPGEQRGSHGSVESKRPPSVSSASAHSAGTYTSQLTTVQLSFCHGLAWPGRDKVRLNGVGTDSTEIFNLATSVRVTSS